MNHTPHILDADPMTGRGRSLNPFIVVADAPGFIAFATELFGAQEFAPARVPTPDGALIHAELRLGDAQLLLCDPQPGWPVLPGLFQIWVSDVAGMLERAETRGCRVVTPPTPFYGSVTLARLEDPWGNLWWLYEPVTGQADPQPYWEGGTDVIFETIDAYMRQRASAAPRDPSAAARTE